MMLFVTDPKRGSKEAAFLESRRHLEVEPSTLSDSERRMHQPQAEYNVTNLESSNVLENCGMSRQIPVSTEKSCLDRIDVMKTGERRPSHHVCEDHTLLPSHTSYQSTWKLMKIPSVVLTILQAAPGALPFGFCATFLNDFLQEQRGMSKEVS